MEQVFVPRHLYVPPKFAISVKGILTQGGRVLLLKNVRDEWELPGGKLDHGEDPTVGLTREFREETGQKITDPEIFDSWTVESPYGDQVCVLAFGCHGDAAAPVDLSDEHKDFNLFPLEEIAGLGLTDRYQQAITAWYARLGLLTLINTR